MTDDSETKSMPPPDESSAPWEPARLATASGIGRYRREAELGRGAFGTVFLAFDEVLKRRVALKILTSQYSGQETTFGEAQSVASLDHPSVVTVYDVGINEDGQVYIVMQYIEGDTLEEVMQTGRAHFDGVHGSCEFAATACVQLMTDFQRVTPNSHSYS